MWVLFWFSFVWLKKSFHYFIYIYIYKYIKIKLLFFFERFYPNTKRFKRTLIYFNTDTVYKFSWKSPLSSYKMILEQQIKWLKTMKMKKKKYIKIQAPNKLQKLNQNKIRLLLKFFIVFNIYLLFKSRFVAWWRDFPEHFCIRMRLWRSY